MERLLYRVGEAAEVLGYSRSKTYELIAKGLLPSFKPEGKSVRVPVEALRDYIRRNTQRPDGAGEGA